MNGIQRNEDGTHGEGHMTDQEIREHVAEHIDRGTDWVNYGDMHPRSHGGRFVRFDPSQDMYQVIETWCCADMFPEGNENKYLIEPYWFEDADIFENGDPAEGFAEPMVDILDALGETKHGIDVCNPDRLERISYYVADLSHYTGWQGDHSVTTEDYWGTLEDFGIDRENYRD